MLMYAEDWDEFVTECAFDGVDPVALVKSGEFIVDDATGEVWRAAMM